jgi:hypothetical protein
VVGPVGRSEQFDAAIADIDAANAQDPNEMVHGGSTRPKELLHAELMTDWVQRLDPSADEAQLLAARAHHFRRWTMPRSEFPEGRAGYLRWRRQAGRRHAEEVGALLRRHGYDDDLVERVGSIIRKESRATDPQVQTHEDALCLVFLETQLMDVGRRLGEDAALEVLSRTIDKMSSGAVATALTLDLEPAAVDLLGRAAGRAGGRAASQKPGGGPRSA